MVSLAALDDAVPTGEGLMQLTIVSVAIHNRDQRPDDEGAIVMTLHTGGDGGFVFDLHEVGSSAGVTLTEDELAALPAARARLLDQFTRQS